MLFAFLRYKNADKVSLTQTRICILRNEPNLSNSCNGDEVFTGKYFHCWAYGLQMNHTSALQRHDLTFFSAHPFYALYMRGLPRAIKMWEAGGLPSHLYVASQCTVSTPEFKKQNRK